MIKLILLIALSLLSACVAIKVESPNNSEFDSAVDRVASVDEIGERLIIEKKLSVRADGQLCSEPLGSILTLGLIPRYCVEQFSATLLPSDNIRDLALSREYEATFLAGWIALFLLPLPEWKYGYHEATAGYIKREIINHGRSPVRP